MLAAVEAGCRVVGLIDGVLIGDLAVSPRELRACHQLGAQILGGGSLGAFRAVECPDAVHGVGEVFAAVRDGIVRDDDELLGTFDASYHYIAYPMVVVRDRCSEAVRLGGLSATDARHVVDRVKQLPFFERSRAGIRNALRSHLSANALDVLHEFLESTSDDIKARDAKEVLATLGRLVR